MLFLSVTTSGLFDNFPWKSWNRMGTSNWGTGENNHTSGHMVRLEIAL